MIATLIETKRPVLWGGALGGGAISLVVHSTLIVAGLYATLHARKAATVARPILDIAMYQQRAPTPPPQAAPIVAPQIRINTLASPTSIPTVIPPPSQVAFDPSRFSGLGTGSAGLWRADTVTTISRAAARPDAVLSAEVVEERPVRIGGPDPAYPELLRRAKIGGQVTVECVVDTAGRTEAGSVRIVQSTHALFEQPARDAAAAWIFQPGRMDGRAVRVRVRIPLIFVM